MARGYGSERRDADRSKMRADKVAEQRHQDLLHKEQFKQFKGNLSTTDATPNRGTGYVTPTSEFQDAQETKTPKPPTQDTLF
jgi:hypothetical protein|tara:strand:+ start:1757 stop:2002 length:246 start_codon:yes stop_codon:yes gene_type:complete